MVRNQLPARAVNKKNISIEARALHCINFNFFATDIRLYSSIEFSVLVTIMRWSHKFLFLFLLDQSRATVRITESFISASISIPRWQRNLVDTSEKGRK